MLSRGSAWRIAAALVAGIACALLVACGSSNNGLIPLSAAGPLQSDFEAVTEAAQSGKGNCSPTESALEKTERDFTSLPTSVDDALRHRLEEGIHNLRTQALAECQKQATTTTTETHTSQTSTSTTPPTTESEENGGTPPPEESEREREHGNENGGSTPENGNKPGGGSPTGGQEPG